MGRGWGTAAELRGTCVCPPPSIPREEADTKPPTRRAQFEKRCAFCPGADMEMVTQGKLLRGASLPAWLDPGALAALLCLRRGPCFPAPHPQILSLFLFNGVGVGGLRNRQILV